MNLQLITKITGMVFCLMVSLVVSPVVTEEPNATLETYSQYITRAFVTPLQAVSTKKDIECLTKAIYYEAANQSTLGKEAVALVITNRVYNKRYPKTICAVVKQSRVVNEKRICQFSYWCDQQLHKPIKDVLAECREIAHRALANHWQRELIDSTMHTAIYYHADYVSPKWRTEKVYVGRVGKHLFYKDHKTLT